MLKQTAILLMCWPTLVVGVGCFQETYRQDTAFDLDDMGEPTSQPASSQPDALASASQPMADTQAAIPDAPAAATTQDVGKKIHAVIETNFGHMQIELWPDVAPQTVASFVKLVKSGFYENMPSHRMIPGFIVQFGMPADPGAKEELEPIKGEFSDTLEHIGGTLSMARRVSDPDSAKCEFFICLPSKNDVQRQALGTLDGKFAIFGQVVGGMTVLDQIQAVPTTTQPRGPGQIEPSKPVKEILLRAIRIVE